MTPEQRRRCEALLEDALDRPAAERDHWLAHAAGDDEVVRREVARLLSLQEQVAETFLEPPPLGWDAPGLEAGSKLGRYEIRHPVGNGGMGVVFKAHDPDIDRPVAIKVLHSTAVDAESRARFIAEARALGHIRHPHVVQVFDVGAADGLPYLVMELLEGETLAAAIREHRTGSLRQRLMTARQIAGALAHVHAAGMLHRDIKPANVFIHPSGHTTLMDFGIARRAAQQTGSRALLGTLDYIAPEQLNGQPATAASDVYAFGVLLYELFSGTRPFGGTTAELVYKVAHEPVPLEPLTAAGVSRPLCRAIAQATDKDPAHRPTLADLDRVLAAAEGATEPGSAPTVGTLTRPGRQPATRALTRLLAPLRRARIGGLGALLLAVVVGAFYIDRVSLQAGDSVAVMPFANAGNDPSLDYVADSLAESITNSLTRLGSLRVTARSTAFSHKGREAQDLAGLGRDLKVRTIVTGRVSRSPRGEIRVQADLVDAQSGTQLWGSQYDGGEDALLHIHDDVVGHITARLRGDTPAAGHETATRPPTTDPGAYDLYLKGRHALSRQTVSDIQRAIDLFQQALQRDPGYAQAYAGLADCYLGLSSMYLPPREAMTKARAAAVRALELDPQLSGAHATYGEALSYYDYDWQKGLSELRKAVTLNPQDASAHLWLAWMLMATGQREAAIREASHAHDLDPLDLYIETGLAQMFYYTGQPAEAIRRLRNVIAADPRFFNGYYFLGIACIQNGQYAEAIEALRQAERLDPQQPQPMAYLAHALAKSGQVEAARTMSARLQALSDTRYVSGVLLAVAAAGFGETEDTLRWLSRAFDDRDDMLSMINGDRALADVQSDPRFIELVRRVGVALD